MDIKPLLNTLTKVSRGRVLEAATVVTEKDITVVQIPVASHLPGDKTDKVLRKYATDWVMGQERVNAEHAFVSLKGQCWEDEVTRESTPVVGCIQITYWPKPS